MEKKRRKNESKNIKVKESMKEEDVKEILASPHR